MKGRAAREELRRNKLLADVASLLISIQMQLIRMKMSVCTQKVSQQASMNASAWDALSVSHQLFCKVACSGAMDRYVALS